MPRAMWNGQVLAQSDDVELVEGNTYFPPSAVLREFLQDSPTHTTCGWKGEASYYPTPKDAARQIAGDIASWKGVAIER